ncbi:MAG TPA: L,D-transpeptidase, partial [Planctomycetota bacterium]|nr:L,D-transpeptidase [Planctomycetota bacterium]
ATPAGEFVVKDGGKDKNPNWTKTLEDGSKKVYKFGDPENILGTRWMGLDEKEGAVGLGIHGTTKDETVPGRKSAGCIRMHNPDVELLYDFTPSGTKVTISNN